MWSLIDDIKVTQRVMGQTAPVSVRTFDEYDCKEETIRRLHVSAHSGNMGGGEVLHIADAPGKWSPVAPGTGAEDLWKFACGVK